MCFVPLFDGSRVKETGNLRGEREGYDMKQRSRLGLGPRTLQLCGLYPSLLEAKHLQEPKAGPFATEKRLTLLILIDSLAGSTVGSFL